MPPFNEIISSAAFANFLKEMQTRFFFLCGGAFLFVFFYRDVLSFHNKSIIDNPTAISGLFVANILAFSFVIYFFAICLDFYFEARKDDFLRHRIRMRKVIDRINSKEAFLIILTVKMYSLSGGVVRKFNVDVIQDYDTLNNNGFLRFEGPFTGSGAVGSRGSRKNGEHWEAVVDSTLIMYLLENEKLMEKVKNKSVDN